MPHPLSVGVDRRDITPAVGTLLMGYADPDGHRAAERVRDPLHATALTFTSEGRRAAIVVLDVGLVEDEHVQQIRAGCHERTGIDPECVTVSAIQTHSAPRTQRVWGWCELDMDYIDGVMVPGAIEAVAEAAEREVPARVGFGQTESAAGVNRRAIAADHSVTLGQNLWAVYDPTMTVLRFEGPDGPLANLVNYGAHPTVLGPSSKVISRDWPGIMIDRMEQLTGAPTLYVNGAVGDIAPRTNSMGGIGDGVEAAMWETGAVAAMDAMRAWRSIKELRDVAMHTIVGRFDLPYRPLPPLEEAKRQIAAFEPRKHEPGAGMAEYKHWQAVVEAHNQRPCTGKPYQQVITAIGPAAIVPAPGEPFGETVHRLRDASPYQHTLCAATSCGNNAYFFTRESINRGGYEVWVNRALGPYLFAEGIDDVLVEQNRALLAELHQQTHPPLKADA